MNPQFFLAKICENLQVKIIFKHIISILKHLNWSTFSILWFFIFLFIFISRGIAKKHNDSRINLIVKFFMVFSKSVQYSFLYETRAISPPRFLPSILSINFYNGSWIRDYNAGGSSSSYKTVVIHGFHCGFHKRISPRNLLCS